MLLQLFVFCFLLGIRYEERRARVRFDRGKPSSLKNTNQRIIRYEDACSQRAGKKYGAKCYYKFSGVQFGGIMFTCENPDTSPQPTSSITVTVSVDAGVATIAPA